MYRRCTPVPSWSCVAPNCSPPLQDPIVDSPAPKTYVLVGRRAEPILVSLGRKRPLRTPSFPAATRFRQLIGTGFLLLAATYPLHAQLVDLQVRESPSRAPVTGAIARLIGPQGVVSQGLTNEQGRVYLLGPRAGQYRLKIDRIGWTGMLTEPFEVPAGSTVRREVIMVSRPIELPALVVTGKSACDLKGAGAVTTVLWEEIGKALTASVLTQRHGRLPIHVREFSRHVALSGQILREWVTASSVIRGRPFSTLPPAVLANAGFVQLSEDSTTYAVPDADLLLSDAFAATHCFKAVPVQNGLVGLEFVPAAGRKVPDVRGTLWLDRTTDDLKYIEFTYTGLEGELAEAGLGGRVDFQRLPTGAWIISHWYARMPRLATSPKGVTLVGFVDRGGKAQLAAGEAGLLDKAVVSGRIYDSTTGGGLAGAVVRVEGHRDSVLTDAAGKFELAVSVSGEHVVSAAHPKLGLLRGRPSRPVILSIGDTTRVEFALPSAATFAQAFCGSSRGRAGIIGLVLTAEGKPAANLDIRVIWLTADGSREERDRSNQRGAYALCNLSPGPTLPVRVQDGRRTLLELKLTLEPREQRWLDLRLPPERD